MIKQMKCGITLVETLVVLAIISALVAILLPAIQAAREASRGVSCLNNIKQIALACQMHEVSLRHLPTGGWGNRWIFNPDKGSGEMQPGGWVGNILPFLEGKDLVVRGEGKDLEKMLVAAMPVMLCPTRRSLNLGPYSSGLIPYNIDTIPANVAKTDFAINGGSSKISGGPGPASDKPYDMAVYLWPDPYIFDGISGVRSKTKVAEITDGLTNTVLLGDKYINLKSSSGDGGDDQSMYVGDDADVRRWGIAPPLSDATAIPTRDLFGSRHPKSANFAFVDGSGRSISFAVNDDVFRNLAGRNNGTAESE